MEFIERVEQLPPRVQDFFRSDEIRLIIERTALAFSVPAGKVSAIAEVVSKGFLSEIELAQLDVEMMRLTGLEGRLVHGVCLEIVRKIFKPFPEVFQNADTAIGKFSMDALEPSISDSEVERALLRAEPWLERDTPKTVLEKRRVNDIQNVKVAATVKTVRLPLLKAMSEYRHLSEQILTDEKIKLKSSLEPVRPSLGNWLRSYREELGIGFHETAKRGDFLFQSQNGKRLSNDARARLNLILKSVEEDFPLEIDTAREVIVFPAGSDASMELTQVKSQPVNPVIRPRGVSMNPVPTALPKSNPTMATAPTSDATVPAIPKAPLTQTFKPLFKKTVAPEKNVSGETLHFSTGHVLPAERDVHTAAMGANEALRQMQHPTQGIRREPKAPLAKNPYSIRPLGVRTGSQSDG